MGKVLPFLPRRLDSRYQRPIGQTPVADKRPSAATS
jgi:hypothetical protein